MSARLALALTLATACSPAPAIAPGPAPDLSTTDGGTTPPPCAGLPGTFHAQTLSVDGEDRHYWLHVPDSYRCDQAWPLLVDFHGTGGGDETTGPEEYYATDGLIEVADAERFIVVRPRSRYASEAGTVIYRWDENPGDLPKNVTFTRQLVAALEAQYHVDAARVYASGFSNGTNMAMQFVADDPPLFHGYGLVAGGIWNEPKRGAFSADAPRIWATTGARDYIDQYLRELRAYLGKRAYPASSLQVRESDTGHTLYGWHFRELFDWLDRGERPQSAPLAAGWTREQVGASESLLELAATPSGDLVATGTGGAIWRRARASGAWQRVAQLATSFAPQLTDVCFLPSGRGLAVGQGVLARSDDEGATWKVAPQVPELSGRMDFGYSYLNAIGCSAARVVGGGYWAAVWSANGGDDWQPGSALADSYPGQVAAVAAGPSGTWIATGYVGFVFRSTTGDQFSLVDTSSLPMHEWLNGIAAGPGGRWWIAGDEGGVLASGDDGLTWAAQVTPTRDDLYAIAFSTDGKTGLAVGAHGAAILTTDGGATWSDVSTGLQLALEDVTFLDDKTVLVVGEAGTVLRRAL